MERIKIFFQESKSKIKERIKSFFPRIIGGRFVIHNSLYIVRLQIKNIMDFNVIFAVVTVVRDSSIMHHDECWFIERRCLIGITLEIFLVL